MFKIKSKGGLYLAKTGKINPTDKRSDTHYWTWRAEIALTFPDSNIAFNYGDQHATLTFKVST